MKHMFAKSFLTKEKKLKQSLIKEILLELPTRKSFLLKVLQQSGFRIVLSYRRY